VGKRKKGKKLCPPKCKARKKRKRGNVFPPSFLEWKRKGGDLFLFLSPPLLNCFVWKPGAQEQVGEKGEKKKKEKNVVLSDFQSSLFLLIYGRETLLHRSGERIEERKGKKKKKSDALTYLSTAGKLGLGRGGGGEGKKGKKGEGAATAFRPHRASLSYDSFEKEGRGKKKEWPFVLLLLVRERGGKGSAPFQSSQCSFKKGREKSRGGKGEVPGIFPVLFHLT